MQRIELGDFLLIAERVTGVDAERLLHTIRINEAMAALAAPFAGFGDFELWPDFEQKAAIYCSRIVTYHPLVDGNKRVGYLTMREFIERNGRTWTAVGQVQDVAGTIEDLAAGIIDERAFIAWVRERVRA
jgi:death on curing protein